MTLSTSSVSIVITTWNHASYLKEAIDSVYQQTVPPSEIIVVDDGSTDRPESVTEGYPEVRLIRQRNQGLAAARNTGLKAASGCFLVFLDADDRLMPRALEVNLEQHRTHAECGFVYGAHDKIDARGETRWSIPLKPLGSDPYASTLEGNPVGMHATVMYQRAALLEIGGFNIRFRACEDYDVYLRMTQRFPAVFRDDCLAEYRQHDSNMSRDSAMMLRAALSVLGQHRLNARTREDWWAAYQRGVQGWKDYYTGEHMRKMFRGETLTGSSIRETAAVVRLAPLTAYRAACEARRAVRRQR